MTSITPPPSLIAPTFEELVAGYRNTAEGNDQIFAQLTGLTYSDAILGAHRIHVEANHLGFGDAAFHAMWLRLLNAAQRRFGRTRLLEIGVYKGQVISLWALIAKHWRFDVQISAITPLVGQPQPRSRLLTWLLGKMNWRFRQQLQSGNFYDHADYERIIIEFFRHLELDFAAIDLNRGLSAEPAVLSRLAGTSFHVVYVDGDHTFDGALNDFKNYGPKVVDGGWLVADDASCGLAGTGFWKGHETVSRAAECLPAMGFRNVLNVGHNRIYQRISR